MDSANTTQIRVTNKKQLAEIRDGIKDLLNDRGVDSSQSFHISQAVDEAVTNIIDHADAKNANGMLIYECINDKFRAYVSSDEPFTDFESQCQASIEALQAKKAKRGYGLAFMHSFVKDIRCEQLDNGGHRLVLEAKLKYATTSASR